MARRGLRLTALVLAMVALAVSQTLGAKSSARPTAEDIAGLEQTALATLQKGDAGQALPMLQRALAADAKWKAGWWSLGSIYYQAGENAPARAAFRRLTELAPKAGEGWGMLGLCDFTAADYGESLAHLQEARALGVHDSELDQVAAYHEGADLILLGRFEQARTVLTPLTDLQPAPQGLDLVLGLAALRLSITPSAAEAALSPSRLALARSLGAAVAEAERRDVIPALAKMAALVKQNPQVPGLHYAFAELLAAGGHSEEADGQFEQELKISPENVPARLQLADDLMQSGKLAEAESYARRALELSPQDAATRYTMGLLLCKQGHWREAVGQLDIAEALSPNDAIIHFDLARAYSRLGRAREAARERAEFQRLLPLQSAFARNGVLPASVYEQNSSSARPERAAQ